MGLLDHLRDAGATPDAFWFFCDFLRADEVVSANGAFTGTAITSGTLAIAAANGGTARLSGAATTDASGYQIQAQAAHNVVADKRLSFKMRAQLNESTSTNVAIESQLEFGLIIIDTSIDASLPADAIYFSKADGGTAIQAICRNGGANAHAITIPTVMDKSMHTYGISINGVGSTFAVEFTLDGATVARIDGATLPTSAAILTPSAAFRSGDNTGTKFFDVDYIGSYQTR